jgi:hypothetical protein
MMTMSNLYKTYTLSWIFNDTSLQQQSAGRHVAPFEQIFWFQANHFLLCNLNIAYLAENQQNTNLIVFGLTHSGLKCMIYCTRGEHANDYTNDMH